MKKFLVLSLAAALAAGTASAQECPGKAGKDCGPAKECDSKAATLTARLFTAYLPPTWGWVTMVWLRRHAYL